MDGIFFFTFLILLWCMLMPVWQGQHSFKVLGDWLASFTLVSEIIWLLVMLSGWSFSLLMLSSQQETHTVTVMGDSFGFVKISKQSWRQDVLVLSRMHGDSVVLVLEGNTRMYSLGRVWMLTNHSLADVHCWQLRSIFLLKDGIPRLREWMVLAFLFMDGMLIFLMAGWVRSSSQVIFLMAGWMRSSSQVIFLMAGWMRSSSQVIFIMAGQWEVPLKLSSSWLDGWEVPLILSSSWLDGCKVPLISWMETCWMVCLLLMEAEIFFTCTYKTLQGNNPKPWRKTKKDASWLLPHYFL